MKGTRGSRTTMLLVAVGVVAAGCDAPAEEAPPGDRLIIDIEAEADPATGTFQIIEAHGRTAFGLVPITVVQDGIPNEGPPNSVELVTEMTGFDADCGFPSSYCGTVRVRSFYTSPLENVFSQLTSIIPFAGHAPLNSDPAQMGLSNTYGLWSYGALQAAGGNNVRLWVFQNDGRSFRFRGRVMGDIVRTGRLLAITGSSGGGSSLYRIDELSGRAVLIGTTGLTHLGGIDIDPVNGLLYAHRNTFDGPQQLYRLDASTAEATLVGETNIQVPDMTFDAAGRLFAWASFGAGAIDDLARIDEDTAAVTLIPTSLSASQTGLFTHPDGRIVVKRRNALYAVDPDLGITTPLGDITGLPGSSHNVADVDPVSGLLYVVIRSATETNLYRVDLSTRVATLVGPISDSGVPVLNVSGLAFE